tara:strand:- start:53 stop:271 length:219 start_codon:yes stop_codon:yes gene_type:complete
MNDHIDELSKGVDDTFDTAKTLVKALIVSYNNEINKLLLESIDKSQTIEVKNKEIERLKDEIHNLDLALKRR